MPAYLITGEAGTGKSTLAIELQKRGYIAYDGDRTPGLTYHADRLTGRPITEMLDRYTETDWVWDSNRLREILNNPRDVFITGATSNQQQFYPVFRKIFMLTIDAATLTNRLQNRSAGDYGMHPEELNEILRTFEGFQRRTIEEDGAIPIDATQPLTKVADDIIACLP
ncbi:AAA family ATPase [Paenibacillus sp. UNC496MF]|uniref:AAA family ATPase n=1 Tax=Paenibacillus sp. UNC496MF TaxID=1502753 RepID=UPI000B8932CF|nr:AAA family ATPase [Paenibacillus sp. UNC496MF]